LLESSSRMMEQKLANNTNRSQRICCRSRADPAKVARCFLISVKSRFLSGYYDSPEPNNEISRQLILMLGSLQLYSKHWQTKSNIFRRCWLRAIEFRTNCWQIPLLLSTLVVLLLSNFRIDGFDVTSSPPCWWTVNKRSLISSLCLSTSICSFHHCYLCLPRLLENHLLTSSGQCHVMRAFFDDIMFLIL